MSLKKQFHFLFILLQTPSAETASVSSVPSSPARLSRPAKDQVKLAGWLYKYTNYVRRYQKRWFVLSNGLLSYYRNEAEMPYRARASIAMRGASIQVTANNNSDLATRGLYFVACVRECIIM